MIGQSVGNYVISRQLGEGGMGAVYLAEHPRIGRKVAIKVLLRELSANAQAVTRFFNEARARRRSATSTSSRCSTSVS